MEAEMASQRGDADTGEVRYTVEVLKHLPNGLRCYCPHAFMSSD